MLEALHHIVKHTDGLSGKTLKKKEVLRKGSTWLLFTGNLFKKTKGVRRRER